MLRQGWIDRWMGRRGGVEGRVMGMVLVGWGRDCGCVGEGSLV